MNLIDIISLLLLFIFACAYLLKLVILKVHNKINANVLANGKKDVTINRTEIAVRTTSSLWLLTWMAEITLHIHIAAFFPYFFHNRIAEISGLVLTTLGACTFILAIIFMKTSWRVGIDKKTKTSLITNGIYKFSRNPAFVGFDLLFIGLFLTYSNMLTFFIMIINIMALHFLILKEEKHLITMFGDEYLQYQNKAPRYFLMF